MKNYTITVNGSAYEVTVEEGFSSPMVTQPAQVVQATAPVQAAAPAPTPVASAPAAATSGSAGKEKVDSPMPGKILSLKANVGQSIKKGDVILILEAMKMENEILAPKDGRVVSITTNVGESVDTGDKLVVIE